MLFMNGLPVMENVKRVMAQGTKVSRMESCLKSFPHQKINSVKIAEGLEYARHATVKVCYKERRIQGEES